MAVVTRYTNNLPDGTLPQSPIVAPARTMTVQGTLETVSGDSIASIYHVASVPSHYVPIRGGASLIRHDSITSCTDVDFGDVNDPDGLADGLDISSAGTKDPFAALDAAEVGQPLWQVLGYASANDAPAYVDLYLTLKAATAAAATISFTLQFAAP